MNLFETKAELSAVPSPSRSKWRPKVGDRFGKLTVIEGEPKRTPRSFMLPCRCDCGGRTYARPHSLRTGLVRSCKCSHIKHNQHKTSLYKSWSGIIQRCTNAANPNYQWYGARGISICAEWLDFETFKAAIDALGARPSPQHSLDRIDNDGNYEPGNVRWADKTEQSRNRRCSIAKRARLQQASI